MKQKFINFLKWLYVSIERGKTISSNLCKSKNIKLEGGKIRAIRSSKKSYQTKVKRFFIFKSPIFVPKVDFDKTYFELLIYEQDWKCFSDLRPRWKCAFKNYSIQKIHLKAFQNSSISMEILHLKLKISQQSQQS